MLTAGTFRARAVDGEFGFSSKNTEQIAVRFQILEGPCRGETITWYGFFNTPENATRAMQVLRRCGWQANDLTDLRGLTDLEVELVLEEEEYEGKKRIRVKWVNEIGGGPTLSRKMDDAQKRAFANRMKGIAASIKPKPLPEKDYPEDWDRQ
jgi:hypothetical protein